MIKDNNQQESLQLFEDQPVRTAWDEEHEEWYFSIVDVVGVLTESKDPTTYWRKLKQRLKEEGNLSFVDLSFTISITLISPILLTCPMFSREENLSAKVLLNQEAFSTAFSMIWSRFRILITLSAQAHARGLPA